MASPYINAPLTPARPRMFNTAVAKVIWTLVPIVTIGLAAAVPFVVAAVKGVVKPWLAVAYVVGEIAVFLLAMAISRVPDDHPDHHGGDAHRAPRQRENQHREVSPARVTPAPPLRGGHTTPSPTA
jgi:hypothetical protein